MKYAVLVVDMLNDNVHTDHHMISHQARQIIPAIQRLLDHARSQGMPVIFSCDSFLPGDFIFEGRLNPHSLYGTEGAEVIDELEPLPGEIVQRKRRLSAFFRSDLDLTLQTLGVDTIVVTGISSQMCVLLSAIDGVCSGFKAIILSDCSAAHKPEVHQTVMDLYGKTALFPLLRVMNMEEWIKENSPA